jgi:hypothetical protein
MFPPLFSLGFDSLVKLVNFVHLHNYIKYKKIGRGLPC